MLHSTPFISEDIDFISLRKNGYTTAKVSEIMSHSLLRNISTETFVPDYDSKYGDGYQPSDTVYSGMYVAKDRMGDRPGGFYEVWLDHVMAWARPYVGMYMNQPSGMDAHLAIAECRSGYFMDWHHDVGERAVAIALLYLCDGEMKDEHGGQLEVAKTYRNADGSVHSREVTGMFSPRHGDLILLDSSSILFEHRVRKYDNPCFHRYFLSATLGIPRG